MCSDFYVNDQIYKALGCVFNRRQQGKQHVYIPKQKVIGPKNKSLVFTDSNDPYGQKISPTSPDHVGHWAHCRAGDKAPLGALQAPDKFNSLVCVWPEKDFCLGRGCDGPHTVGLDAWFPFSGWEYSARDYNIRFDVLVDDGKSPDLYSWIKVCRLAEQESYKPVLVHGMSPMVVNNVLGKGSTEYLTAWTCEAGTERDHNKDEVLRSLVLCVRQITDQPSRGWREIHIHEPARVTDNMVRTEVIASCKSIGNNIDDKSKALRATLKYTSEEGQDWKPYEVEECDLVTRIKSENVLRKLAEANLPIGMALYGTQRQSVEVKEMEIGRNYEVPPLTKMTVTMKILRQEVVLDCPAMEHVFTRDGRPVLKRLVSGTWRAVTTRYVEVDVVETNCERVMNSHVMPNVVGTPMGGAKSITSKPSRMTSNNQTSMTASRSLATTPPLTSGPVKLASGTSKTSAPSTPVSAPTSPSSDPESPPLAPSPPAAETRTKNGTSPPNGS